ncbi:MAG: hypothetical protein UZ13_03232 [Chloroflexi bacterium OLB13]|nr:MAG: hypothetical protein UZ13_03232 [Chloroflexi bacterium OLB13]
MSRARRDYRLDLSGWRRHFQQGLKSARAPRSLLVDQAQAGRLVQHVGGEHEARDDRRLGQRVDRLRLDRQETRLVPRAVDLLEQRGGVGRFAFHGADDDLVVVPEMLARQSPDVDSTAVFGEESRCFAGDVLPVDAPHRQPAILHPFPGMAQVAELDALAAGGGCIVVVRRVEPRGSERIVRRDQPLDVAAHRLCQAESHDAGGCSLSVQFVGVGRQLPRHRRSLQKRAFSGERIQQPDAWMRRCH